MSNHIVPVIKLDNISIHPNADSLEIVQIFGYQCVVRKDQFHINDLVAYIEPDYLVPVSEPEFSFLAAKAKEGFVRITAMRLRGENSFGLVIPARPGWEVGDNVLDTLGIKRYEPFIPGANFIQTENEVSPNVYAVKYDMENYRRYNNIIQIGEEVCITEKLNGCVWKNTGITMSDGSSKKITKIKEGDSILGVENGVICESKVISVFNNGKTNGWLRIYGGRANAGRGNSFFAVFCTPEHKFYIPSKNEYVEAKDLIEGTDISLFRYDYGLNPLQYQVLLGKLLGDGSLRNIGTSAHVSFSHKEEVEEYFDWTTNAFGDLNSGAKEHAMSGFGTKMIRGRTTNTWWIKEEFKDFIKENVKIVPDWVEQRLGPIGISFWYMDDGFLGHTEGQEDRVGFSTCAFDEGSQNVLIKALRKFNIESEVKIYNNYPRIFLNADNAEKLFLLIAPYIPKIMQYKLPERYRGHQGWLPKFDLQYKPALVINKITSIKKLEETYERYDLETTSHNYFASGVLVHNCNSRFTHTNNDDIHFHVGSHTCWKRRNPQNMWWKAAAQYDLENKLQKYPDHIFYGELYGNVGGFRYGFKDNNIALAFFDIMYKGVWLDVPEVKSILEELDLPMVPVLYQGQWKEEFISMSDGQTTIPNANHIREGIVVKPIKERVDPSIGRVILKIVGMDYLEGKKKR